MSRTLSAAATSAIFSQETDEVFLVLMVISHASLAADIRLVNNTVDLVSRTNNYIGFPFGISLPDDSTESIASVALTIDNIDRQIVDAIRSIATPPDVTIEVVMASSPDTVEAGPFNMTLKNVDYDAMVVTGELMFEDVLNESFPGDKFQPVDFPGLF